MDFDVIVVGGGPGGSSAAHDLAAQGLQVGLFEKERFPREKPCGGCLSLKIDRILEPDFHQVVEREIYGSWFSFRGTDEFHIGSEQPIAYMVMRSRFDQFMLDRARRGGVRVYEDTRVKGIEETDSGVRVAVGSQRYESRYLIAADGATGIIARCLGLDPGRRVAACVESETISGSYHPEDAGSVRLEMGSIPFGYGWVFPKGDHLSVGVGGLKGKADNPRSYYDDFVMDQDLADAVVEGNRRGYIIPVFSDARTPRSKGRTLLVGDAAALVDPFIGEGVYYAIRSGQLAAQAIVDDDGEGRHLSTYDDLLREEIYSEFRAARNVAFFLYAFPEIGYRILKRRRSFGRLYFQVMRGEAAYGDLWREQRRSGALDVVRALWPESPEPGDIAGHYDRIAPRYDAALRLWRKVVVEPAWTGLGDTLDRLVPAGSRVLDAGTGTGEAVQLLLERAEPAEVVGVDLSKGMLRVARKKIRDPRVRWEQADATELTYAEGTFDIVLSTWTLETVLDPKAAVSEFLRLINDDGFVIYAFSSRPLGVSGVYARLLEEWASGTLRGRFLTSSTAPVHDCGNSHAYTYARGLATVVVLRKCCTVNGKDAACLPMSA